MWFQIAKYANFVYKEQRGRQVPELLIEQLPLMCTVIEDQGDLFSLHFNANLLNVAAGCRCCCKRCLQSLPGLGSKTSLGDTFSP